MGLSVTPLYVLEVAKVKQPATNRTQSAPLPPKKQRTSNAASGMTAVAAASRPSAARCSRSGSFFGDGGDGPTQGVVCLLISRCRTRRRGDVVNVVVEGIVFCCFRGGRARPSCQCGRNRCACTFTQSHSCNHTRYTTNTSASTKHARKNTHLAGAVDVGLAPSAARHSRAGRGGGTAAAASAHCRPRPNAALKRAQHCHFLRCGRRGDVTTHTQWLRCLERARDLTSSGLLGSYSFFSIPEQGSKG